LEIVVPPASTLSIYLFGSFSRGEQTPDSDLDLLIITDESRDEAAINDFLNLNNLASSDVSIYSYNRLKEYFQQGHLFAWHLFLESKILNGLDIISALGEPKKYKDFENDSIQIIELINSIILEIEKKDSASSLNYEAGLLYLSMRNFSHFFSASFLKNYCFSRFTPYQLNQYSILEVGKTEYEILMRARFSSVRGHAPEKIKREWLLNTCIKTKTWVNELIRVSHEI